METEKLTPWQKYKKDSFQLSPWTSLSPETQTVDKETEEKRFSICKTCPEFIKITKQCKKDGCFMATKTKIESATCPIGAW